MDPKSNTPSLPAAASDVNPIVGSSTPQVHPLSEYISSTTPKPIRKHPGSPPQSVLVCTQNESSFVSRHDEARFNTITQAPSTGNTDPIDDGGLEQQDSLQCDVCLAKSEAKNILSSIPEEECTYSSLVPFPKRNFEGNADGDGKTQHCYPFKDALDRAKRRETGSFVMRMCYRCRFQVRELSVKKGKRYQKLLKTYRNQIMNRIERNQPVISAQHTVETIKCKLHRIGSQPCSTNDKVFYRPRCSLCSNLALGVYTPKCWATVHTHRRTVCPTPWEYIRWACSWTSHECHVQ